MPHFVTGVHLKLSSAYQPPFHQSAINISGHIPYFCLCHAGHLNLNILFFKKQVQSNLKFRVPLPAPFLHPDHCSNNGMSYIYNNFSCPSNTCNNKGKTSSVMNSKETLSIGNYIISKVHNFPSSPTCVSSKIKPSLNTANVFVKKGIHVSHQPPCANPILAHLERLKLR